MIGPDGLNPRIVNDAKHKAHSLEELLDSLDSCIAQVAVTISSYTKEFTQELEAFLNFNRISDRIGYVIAENTVSKFTKNTTAPMITTVSSISKEQLRSLDAASIPVDIQDKILDMQIAYEDKIVAILDPITREQAEVHKNLLELTIIEKIHVESLCPYSYLYISYPDINQVVRKEMDATREYNDDFRLTSIPKDHFSAKFLEDIRRRAADDKINAYIVKNPSSRIEGNEMSKHVYACLKKSYSAEQSKRRTATSKNPVTIMGGQKGQAFGWYAGENVPQDLVVELIKQSRSGRDPKSN